MSLEINHLTKVYGAQKAVNDISFSLSKGEIVGFLGPNGAGKSTTMKVATGYISPTDGTVYIGGYDVREKPQEVKRITGYLPEHNPLYLDLFVHEYLLFVGRLYGLRGTVLTQRVNEMVELCGLTREQGKKIEALSKGYRQRVGLAQALIHNPDVLILDEPTSGLDPNQILEIRKLIKDISINKTVLFSSHIMQEVQALCNRVVVINRGVIVANDQLSNVMQLQKGVVIIVEFERPVPKEDLLRVRGVKEVIDNGGNTYRISGEEGVDLRPEIFRFAADNNLSLVGLRQEENSLENIFRDLTISSPQ